MCGVVPDRADARLPSAAKVRASSPVAVFEIDYVDMIDVASSDPTLDEFFASSGHINPSQPSPDPSEDDNNNLDLFDDVNDDDSASPSFFESSYDAVLFPAAVPHPTMSDMDLMTACTDALDPGTKALHALDLKLRAIGQSRSAFYGQLRTDVPTVVTCAHADGGSMATTTDRLDLLWHLKWIPEGERRNTALKVADDRAHHPTAHGFLRVPTDSASGFRMVRSYYTPTLPATILSPSAMGGQFHCRGYTSISNFDGNDCSLSLHHCRRVSEDVTFPLTLVRGLLYTLPLVAPTTHAERYEPIPMTTLHLRKVSTELEESPVSSCSPCGSSAPGAAPCTCNTADVPAPSSTSDALYEKILHYQRLGYQLDVSMDALAEHADGVPSWSSSSPTCGSCSTSAAVSGEGPAVVDSGEGTDAGEGSGSAVSTAGAATTTAPTLAELLLDPADENEYVISHLTRDQLRVLWHQRLGHLHSRRVSDMHMYAEGVPQVPIATELDTCPICAAAKLRKAARGTADSRHVTQCNQGISVDFGFLVQKSKDSDRVRRLQGLNGETCYCLITDHHSGKLFGEAFRSKAPPLDFLNRWLAQYGLPQNVADKYVRLDLGGELGKCQAVVDLFARAGYALETTAADSSHQNGPGERPHQTIADGMRAMLGGAGLPPKFWPYAFHHFLRIYNVTVHRDQSASPFEICSGIKPNLRQLRVFGCRVYALPARPHRPDKLLSDARVGIFLGYSKTLSNVLYYDTVTETIKTAQHVAFDESMNDLDDKPPNARLLDGLRNARPDVLDFSLSMPDLDVASCPFTGLSTVTVSLELESDAPFGFVVDACRRLQRAFVTSISRAATRQSLRSFRKKYLGSYVVSINDEPVFSVADVARIAERLRALPTVPDTVPVVLAPERTADFDDRPPPLHLRMHDLRHVCALQSVSGEGKTFDEYRTALSAFESDLTDIEMTEVIHRLQTEGMTMEERRLKRFTRRNLQKLPNWPDWDAAFDAQLDAHFKMGTISAPIPKPKPVHGRSPNICRVQWSNLVKADGTRKCRACIDGSKRSAPWLRDFAQTYASCVEQPCMRLFFALSAALGLVVTVADTTNAFQQSPPPSEKCYLAIDDAFRSWHRKRFGMDVHPDTHCVPVERAFQGHPEAGALWERMIVGILEGDELGFVSTTHERNLYRGTIDGALVLVCRQVDDFAIATASPDTAEKLIAVINKHATTTSKGIGVKDAQGIGLRYNGIDIHQTRNYTKLSCETYIDRLLQTHGWEKPAANESDRFDVVPLPVDSVEALLKDAGPSEGSKEHRELAEKVGFGYRMLLGELMYAFVVCRLDIGFAVTLLARFSTCPSRLHYMALKSVTRYLRRTKDWGLIYWRQAPLDSLPAVPLEHLPIDDSLPPYPTHDLLQLVGQVDAAHATDLATRRSVTGLVFSLAGGAIAYKSKLQATVATSSTEAEFIGAVHAAKIAKYLRSVLHELGFEQDGATPLYVDNQAAIAMINEGRPTPRSRHIDIQHFAIQEWRQRGIVEMHHLPGVINNSDQLTKALGWTLHSRHARRSMGHYGPGC